MRASGTQPRIKFAAVAAGLLILLWLSVGVTLTNSSDSRASVAALAIWPFGAQARDQLAEDILKDEPSAGELVRARELAVAALNRQPLDARAGRLLGLVLALQGDSDGANRAFNYVERLSRRDLTTELFLIERDVSLGRIDGALRHYNHALLTTEAARAVLFPVLSKAVDDPRVLDAVLKVLSKNPLWGRPFLQFAAKETTNFNSLLSISKELGLTASDALDLSIGQTILGRLVSSGDYSDAFALYSFMRRREPPLNKLLRNGDFESDDSAMPFDWWYRTEPTLSAARELRQGNGGTRAGLALAATNDRGGEVAHQLLVLQPGRYRLTAVADGVSANAEDRPQIAVGCAAAGDGNSGGALGAAPLAAGDGELMALDFTVPSSGCTAQWVSIVIAPAAETNAWIDDLKLVRLQ